MGGLGVEASQQVERLDLLGIVAPASLDGRHAVEGLVVAAWCELVGGTVVLEGLLAAVLHEVAVGTAAEGVYTTCCGFTRGLAEVAGEGTLCLAVALCVVVGVALDVGAEGYAELGAAAVLHVAGGLGIAPLLQVGEGTQ